MIHLPPNSLTLKHKRWLDTLNPRLGARAEPLACHILKKKTPLLVTRPSTEGGRTREDKKGTKEEEPNRGKRIDMDEIIVGTIIILVFKN
jgi:hypothetical protein